MMSVLPTRVRRATRNQDNHRKDSFKSWICREARKEDIPWGSLADRGLFPPRPSGMRAVRPVCSNLSYESSLRVLVRLYQVDISLPFSLTEPLLPRCITTQQLFFSFAPPGHMLSDRK